jgi:hypothetical protein
MRCAAGLLLPTILLLHAYSRRMRTFAKSASALWMEETRNSKKLEKSVEDDSSRVNPTFPKGKG